ncbi:SGNH/GDSL hydrolase family protein [Jannaschia sp. W003]|uniref:SGNH/GDSL hydrolase family protein n=1 Tax=Jannaschia sp. W003 TaxID=2867012 RepID=UPI0021A5A300|nr:SGNH/GDSL hydrolase family protein [Jannaschia sp. W003]UWQ22327.1 SGNH/GDSL hydrolase family protein [Jannaschia sp. W003]
MRIHLAALLAPALLVAACVTSAPPDQRAVLAVGDSVLAWNDGRGVPEVAAAALGLPVVDATQSGAFLLNDSGVVGLTDFSIQRQWAANRGRWAWVILDGGGNDLRGDCGTPAEVATTDALIAPDGRTGAIPALIASIRATGSRAAFLGYYDDIVGRRTGFSACAGAFDRINARVARLAAADPGLMFLDAAEVIDPRDAALYDADAVHPSPEGSRRIGAALAARMR